MSYATVLGAVQERSETRRVPTAGGETDWSYRALREHIAGKLDAAKLDVAPFPHLIIEDFWPSSVYASILEHNLFKTNRGTPWISKRAMLFNKNSTPYDHRTQINFHQTDDYVASDAARAFWANLTQVFLDGDWFLRLVYAKFPAYFDIRFGEVAASGELWPRLRRELFLQRHDPNYYIGPHTDIPTRIFTCIFSYAERSGFEDFGTQLLQPRDPFVRCWGNAHYDFSNFTLAKTAEYRPNNFLLFFKTRQSFHAVKTVSEEVPNQRYGMQFQCYEPGGGVFQELSKPDLLLTRHSSLLGKVAQRILTAAPFRRS